MVLRGKIIIYFPILKINSLKIHSILLIKCSKMKKILILVCYKYFFSKLSSNSSFLVNANNISSYFIYWFYTLLFTSFEYSLLVSFVNYYWHFQNSCIFLLWSTIYSSLWKFLFYRLTQLLSRFSPSASSAITNIYNYMWFCTSCTHFSQLKL